MSEPPRAGRIEHWATRASALAGLLLVAGVLFGNAITELPFHTKGEPREALVVQRMFEDQQYILVRRNADEIPSKPPLFHWLGTAAAVARGKVDEVATRLPSVAATLLLLATTTLLAFRWWGTVPGLVAGAVLLTTQQVLSSATTARVDMVFASCVALAIAAAGSALREQRRIPLIFYAASALAVLAKGPAGYVLPIAVCGTYALASRRIPPPAHLRIAPGAAILALPIVWYAAAWWIGGQEFLDKLLLKENIYRVLDPDSVAAGHVRPFWFYAPALLGAAAPWSLWLPPVLVAAWRDRGRLDDQNLLLPLLWLGVTIAIFSLSASKRAVYLLPCYPAIALLIGHWSAKTTADAEMPGTLRIVCLVTTAIVYVVIVLIALAALGAPTFRWVEPLFASETDRANLAILGSVAEALRCQLLVWAAVSFLLAGVVTRSLLRRHRMGAVATGTALIVATTAFVGVPMQRAMADRQTVRPFIERVQTAIAEDEKTFFFQGFDYGAVYYLGRAIPTVEDAQPRAGRNRVWYFVWERSVDVLCERIRKAHPNDGRRRCHEYDRYDFFGNPKREDLVLIAASYRPVRRSTRSENRQ